MISPFIVVVFGGRVYQKEEIVSCCVSLKERLVFSNSKKT